MPWIIPGIITSYLLGSIPTAYLFGRFLKGIDIRKFGSGNVGATNALRVLGRGAGITVLILDIFKGFIAVVFLGNILFSRSTFLSEEMLRVILGLACICGHNWTIFLRFKGGKGIATTFGALLGLSLKLAGLKFILGLVILSWLVVFVITRIVSLASIIAAITLPFYAIIFNKESKILVPLSILLSIFALYRHKSNLKRLFQGKEPRTF